MLVQDKIDYLIPSFKKLPQKGSFFVYRKHLKRIEKYKFWKDRSQAKEIHSKEFFYEKLEYIHNIPVEEMIVSKAEDYLFSSARNYAELSNWLDIVVESSKQVTYK